MPKTKRIEHYPVRPLTSRILKSIQDTLRPYLSGASVLDLYAGKGRFGDMALCEGATFATFVEQSRELFFELRKLLSRHKAQCDIVHDDVFDYLQRAHRSQKTFDIIFADPPFPIWDNLYATELSELVASVAHEDTIFLVRYPKKMIAFSEHRNFKWWKTSRFGDSIITYFEYAEDKTNS